MGAWGTDVYFWDKYLNFIKATATVSILLRLCNSTMNIFLTVSELLGNLSETQEWWENKFGLSNYVLIWERDFKFLFLQWSECHWHVPYFTLSRDKEVVKRLGPRFGKFCSCSCVPLLPHPACRILATCVTSNQSWIDKFCWWGLNCVLTVMNRWHAPGQVIDSCLVCVL